MCCCAVFRFVQLSTLEEARKAVKQLNNTAIGPVQRIQVELTHTTTSWNVTSKCFQCVLSSC